MVKLVRCVRFSINPFLAEDSVGFNSYASQPAGEGLGIFLELSAGLVGQVDEATGFVVNVSEIDKCVRESVVPIFARRIREEFRDGRHIGFGETAELLRSAQEQLEDKFRPAILAELGLKLNPFRKVAIDCEDRRMIYISEKFEFAATHKLWNDQYSEEKNLEVFGKCANPSGHGHNYVLEVTVKRPEKEEGFSISGFEKTVDEQFIKLVDHKNLNVDVGFFGKANPTVENITRLAWESLAGKFEKAKLHCVTVWETDKAYCSYYG